MARRFFAVLLTLALVGAACGDDDAGGAGAVSIDSPVSGTQVATGTSLTIQVTASDDGGVSRIDLQYGGQTILSITNNSGANPFVAVQSWTPTEPASSNLVAVGYRGDGSVIGSDQVALTVTGDSVTTTTAPGTEETTTTAGGTGTTAGGTGTTAGGTGTTAGGTGTTAGTTSTTAGTTTTTTGAQVAPDDGQDGSTGSPPEHSVFVFAENNSPETVVFEEKISVPGDRGDGIRIFVDNLFQGTNQDNATVSVQFLCDPGGPKVRGTPAGYTGGSNCDFTYNTTFEASYQSDNKTYYIYVPDGVEGYFEYTVLITATRH